MKRLFFFTLLVVGLMTFSASGADVEVAPPPREIRPDGTRDPAPTTARAQAQNPLETVERIIKNSKAVGDKLAMTDTGADTRKTQEAILKDIQSLIDQQDNPPPKSDQNQDKNDKNNDSKSDNKDKKDNKSDTMPMNGMNDMQQQKKDMQQQKDMPPNGGMDQPHMGGDSDQPKGRKPRQKDGDQPKEKGSNPIEQANNGSTSPTKKTEPPKNSQPPKQPVGMVPNPMSKGDQPPPKATIPPEEVINKDVWGYLPDKLRVQAMQYYKQEFMPRYEKLLEHYYSSLDDKKNKK